jgi:dephospho-CoA kinase
MILRVGLTGGIASGKSTIARMLARLGCTVIDADRIVSDLYAPRAAGWQALVDSYGPELLDLKGEIDRPLLAAIAFRDAATAARLNALIHPLVIEEEERRMAEQKEGIVVVEASLLLEAGGRERYERIIVVDLDPETQIERAVQRGMQADEAVRRRERQMPRSERLRFADYVIDNSGSLPEAEMQTFRVHRQLLLDLDRKRARTGR